MFTNKHGCWNIGCSRCGTWLDISPGALELFGGDEFIDRLIQAGWRCENNEDDDVEEGGHCYCPHCARKDYLIPPNEIITL